jgi:hypothetical protein
MKINEVKEFQPILQRYPTQYVINMKRKGIVIVLLCLHINGIELCKIREHTWKTGEGVLQTGVGFTIHSFSLC